MKGPQISPGLDPDHETLDMMSKAKGAYAWNKSFNIVAPVMLKVALVYAFHSLQSSHRDRESIFVKYKFMKTLTRTTDFKVFPESSKTLIII